MAIEKEASNLPLVSIITGYYNRTENLQISVQSVLDQSYSNFEYIIFDDCSTDGTYELLKVFNDPRLLLIRNEVNTGLTKGLINAVSRSKGEFIAIHGAGDVSYKDRIAKQVNHLLNNPKVGIVGCLLEDVSNEGTIIHSPVSHNTNHDYTHGEVLYRKNLYYRAGGYNALFEFGQFTPLKRGILKYSLPGHVDEVLYKRIHFANGVTKNKSKIIEQKIYITLGKELSGAGNFFTVDTAAIVVKICLQHLHLLIKGSKQEQFFLSHLNKRSATASFLYKLYTKKLLPARVFKYFTSRIFG